MHKQRIAVAALGIIGIIATFLPWVNVPILGSISAAKAGDWLTLVLYLPIVILAFIGDKKAPLLGKKRIGATILAVLASLIAIVKMSDIKSVVGGEEAMKLLGDKITIGFGLYIAIGAGFVIAVVAFLLAKGSAPAPAPEKENEA
ncbi:hypothetical protein KKF84_00360 [Myxococcota bacterium]|nr:hypothetical protein [Myxococcota bacterium]MBU1533736.1 hypothetical protein [Myxococcota bacterium]